ncbi:hypothetical protein [Marivivens marinus]|uniref:hypothetical protein n=1 Tax=Marivivens marinus TaxID=3110173 RepID=UPI003B84A3BB
MIGRMTISNARKRIGWICTHVQDPRNYVVLLRHGKPIAAVVSMVSLKRIQVAEDQDETGHIRHPLYDIWQNGSGSGFPGWEIGRRGKMVTAEEAARELRTLQLTRAEERRILQKGGLEPVPGGELMEERPAWAVELWAKQRKWWGLGRFRR